MLALLILSIPPLIAGPVSGDLQWKLIAATPRIVSTQGVRSIGTAVCIGVQNQTAYLLTAEHVVRGGAGFQLEFFTRESYPKVAFRLEDARVVKSYRVPDLALIAVPVGKHDVPSYPLSGPGQRPKQFPFAGLSIGNNAERFSLRSETIIAKQLVRSRDDVAFYWEMEKASDRGRSGGPLVDAQGRLIGIITATQQGKSYALHLDEILVTLKREQHAWLYEKK